MRIVFRSMLVILLLLSEQALAGRWLIGASVGIASGEKDTDTLNADLMSRNINAQASSSDVQRMTQQFYIGYDFTSNWGMEFGYVDLGEVEVSVSGTVIGVAAFLDQAEDVYPQTAEGWKLSGVYRYPVSGEFQLMAKAGAYQWTSDYILQIGAVSRDVSEEGTGFSLGFGLEAGKWIMQSGFVGLLSWDLYRVDRESVNVLAIGVSYRFE